MLWTNWNQIQLQIVPWLQPISATWKSSWRHPKSRHGSRQKLKLEWYQNQENKQHQYINQVNLAILSQLLLNFIQRCGTSPWWCKKNIMHHLSTKISHFTSGRKLMDIINMTMVCSDIPHPFGAMVYLSLEVHESKMRKKSKAIDKKSNSKACMH